MVYLSLERTQPNSVLSEYNQQDIRCFFRDIFLLMLHACDFVFFVTIGKSVSSLYRSKGTLIKLFNCVLHFCCAFEVVFELSAIGQLEFELSYFK